MWGEMKDGVLRRMRCEVCAERLAERKLSIQDDLENYLDIAYLCVECCAERTAWAGRTEP